MKLALPIEIVGTGASVPEQVVTNHDFAKRMDTSDEWIIQRTGIHERRFASQQESTLTFAAEAGRRALADAGVTPDQVGLIIAATFTADHTLPALACQVQAALGCNRAAAFDLNAACSGFVYAMTMAATHLHNGLADYALIIGAETMSRVTDMEDRATCVLFGDGAGAAVLRRSADPARGLLAGRLGADGSRAELIWVPAGGTREPASLRTVNERLHYVRMKGREVYKFAVTQMERLIADTLADAEIETDDVALFIPHQSNLRIIESAIQKLGIPESRVLINIQRYGNTSAASVALALDEARRGDRIRAGDRVLIVAFGAGLTWASALLRF
ncbi:MAG: beta-ketoacyl-ACP synthase III [Phycisphaerae bacterium]